MLLCRLLRRAAPILFVCLIGTNLSHVAAAQTSQLGGFVYIDRNNDGLLAFVADPNPEFVIGGVEIRLFSQVGMQESLLATVQTDDGGRYFFDNLDSGTYSLKQTQPVAYVDGLDTLGVMQSLNNQLVPGSASVGDAINNAFINIMLPANVRGDFFNFGERGLAPGFVSKRNLLGSAPILPMAVIPEPTTGLLAIGAAICGLMMRRRRRG